MHPFLHPEQQMSEIRERHDRLRRDASRRATHGRAAASGRNVPMFRPRSRGPNTRRSG